MAWSQRWASRGPKRDANSSRGSGSNWPIRQMPNECSSSTVSAGSRKALDRQRGQGGGNQG